MPGDQVWGVAGRSPDPDEAGRLPRQVVAFGHVAGRGGGIGVERGRGAWFAGGLVQPGGDGGAAGYVGGDCLERLQPEDTDHLRDQAPDDASNG